MKCFIKTSSGEYRLYDILNQMSHVSRKYLLLLHGFLKHKMFFLLRLHRNNEHSNWNNSSPSIVSRLLSARGVEPCLGETKRRRGGGYWHQLGKSWRGEEAPAQRTDWIHPQKQLNLTEKKRQYEGKKGRKNQWSTSKSGEVCVDFIRPFVIVFMIV